MKKNENKIIDNNFCFSKVLKDFDARIKFKNNKSDKLTKFINKRKLKERETINEDSSHSLIKIDKKENSSYDIYTRNFKNLNFGMLKSDIDLPSNINNNIFLLSKISKFKNENNTNFKHEFQDDRKNEDFNNIRFEKVWKAQYLDENKNNENKEINNNTNVKDINNINNNYKNKTIYNNHNYIIDIFDKNYDKQRKQREKFKEKKLRIARVKSNNLKVEKKLKMYQEMLSKFKDQREYCPNYSIIEKHKPDVKLNTNSQRIFPIQIIKQNLHISLNSNDLNSFNISYNKNNLFDKKKLLKKNNSNFPKLNNKVINNKNKNENFILGEKNRTSISAKDIKNNFNNSVFKGIKNKNKSLINRNKNNIFFKIKNK